jgi:arginine deiminase
MEAISVQNPNSRPMRTSPSPAPPMPRPASPVTPAAAERSLFVGSEVGALQRVIVHRPGGELRRVTPKNKRELLFDDVVWVNRARQEHDAFVAALRSCGAEVLYLHELLAQTLAISEVRESVIRDTLAVERVAPELGPALAAWLSALPAEDFAEWLVRGITLKELPLRRGLLARADLGAGEAFVVAPLPNHVYTRDTSAWAYGGVSVHRMAKPSRRRESIHINAIYEHHPAFAGSRHHRWGEGPVGGESLEGGDILVIGNGCVLVGFGERTRPAAVERYARQILSAGAATRVIAIALPVMRSSMHLDTVMTMVDSDAFVINATLKDRLIGHSIVEARGALRVTREDDLFSAIARALEVPQLRLVSPGQSVSRREQWEMGNNTLALAPGVVVAYEHNTATNSCLQESGIEVLTVPGSELARGHGGPRCMSCPIARAAVS